VGVEGEFANEELDPAEFNEVANLQLEAAFEVGAFGTAFERAHHPEHVLDVGALLGQFDLLAVVHALLQCAVGHANEVVQTLETYLSYWLLDELAEKAHFSVLVGVLYGAFSKFVFFGL